MLIETLVSEPPVERLGKGVVGGFAGSRELQLHAVVVGPGIEGLGDELWSVVDGDTLGRPRRCTQPLRDPHHAVSGQGHPDLDGWTHPADVIHYRQDPESPAVSQAVSACTFYSHYVATFMVAKGVPMRVVMDILGQSRMATTADLYTHVLPAAHREVTDLIDQSPRPKTQEATIPQG